MSSKQILQATKIIDSADAIVVGIGAGLSAAGGLNFNSKEVVKRFYPEYFKLGFNSLFELIGSYWSIDKSIPELYWGFWGQHIKNIRYDSKVTHLSTNVDGQYEKSNLDPERLFAPQGNYSLFQCSKPCSNEVYQNEEMITKMVENMQDPYSIRKDDIPICPRCGRYLIPNLRSDDKFVEKPHMRKRIDYQRFINDNCEKNILFMELGVGFNSPGVIRAPFDYMTFEIPNAKLLRINFSDDQVPFEIKHKTLMIKGDLKDILEKIKKS